MTYNTSHTVVTLLGTNRITDTATYSDLRVYSIIPETDTVVDTLTVVKSDGTTENAVTVRNLTVLKAGIPYLPGGDGSYFSVIKLTSGIITINK